MGIFAGILIFGLTIYIINNYTIYFISNLYPIPLIV